MFEVEKLVRDMVPPVLWKSGMRSSGPPSEVAVIGFIVFDAECRIALPLCARSGQMKCASPDCRGAESEGGGSIPGAVFSEG
ncbi:hypothetical protein V2V90_11950 [Agrobacterium leguminum]|uniref:hypothetical protein n=1 Tax=Agrobacterium leguminum TaxID=2792015 RepID=UPI0030CEC879